MELDSSKPINELDDFRSLIFSWQHEGLSLQQIRGMLFEQDLYITEEKLAKVVATSSHTDRAALRTSSHESIETDVLALSMGELICHSGQRHPEQHDSQQSQISRRRSGSSVDAIPLIGILGTARTFATQTPTTRSFEAADKHQGGEQGDVQKRVTGRERMVSPSDSFFFTDDESDHGDEHEYVICLMESRVSQCSTSSCITEAIEVGSKRTTLYDSLDILQVLLKMAAAEMGLPRADCCCGPFFDGTLPISQRKELYHLLISDSETNESLLYTKAVARLSRDGLHDHTTVARLHASFEFHNKLLDRPKMRNNAAYAIAVELATILDGIPSEDEEDLLFVKRLIAEVYGSERDYWTRSSRLRDKYSHLYSGLHRMPVRLKPTRNPAEWVDQRSHARRVFENKLLQSRDVGWLYPTIADCRELISQPENLAVITNFATTITPWSYHDGFTHARVPYERLNAFKLAQTISSTLSAHSVQVSWPLDVPADHCLMALVFQAIGLIVSQAFQEHQRPGRLSEGEALTHILNAVGVLNIQSKFSTRKSAKAADFGHQILQAMWICDSDRKLFAPQGLHYGPCKAVSCWQVASQSVTQFDQSTTLVAPTALPSSLQLKSPTSSDQFLPVKRKSLERVRSLSDRMVPKSSKLSALFRRKS